MKSLVVFIFFVALACFPNVAVGESSFNDNIIYAFKDTQSNSRGKKMVIIGETVSIDKATVFEAKKQDIMLDYDTRPDIATVRISYNPGIKIGQKLYLIEKHPDHVSYKDGNIVGEITVKSIFKTTFFGQQLRGIGRLRLIGNRTMTVAMDTTSDKIEKALIAKKEGDYYYAKGEIEKAIKSYKEAIHYDSLYPEVHSALGKLHINGGEGYISAGYEYRLAWEHKHKFLDEHEKFEFLKNYINFLIYKFKIENKKRNFSIKDLVTALEVQEEAEKLEKNNFDISLSTAKVYYYLYKYAKSGIIKEIIVLREEKKKKEKLNAEKCLEYTGKYLDKAAQGRKQDKELHKMAIYYYMEKLNNIGENSFDASGKNDLREKLLYHAKNFKKYKYNSKSDDKIVNQILYKIESL
ncbi:MAG: tetratricopeptide repeat protein [Leptospiraceae bacterium]|nr:tetratricopeptide repeat protein [Leptospiraceae bacterium]